MVRDAPAAAAAVQNLAPSHIFPRAAASAASGSGGEEGASNCFVGHGRAGHEMH